MINEMQSMLHIAKFRLWMPGLIMAVIALPVVAQSLDQRIADYRRKQGEATERQAETEAKARAHMIAKMRAVVENVNIQQVPLRRVLAWYHLTTQVPLVINWRALEAAGVDPEQEISIQLKAIRAGQLLSLIMQLASPNPEDPAAANDATLIYDMTPWYLQIMTKSQANQHPVTRIYDVMDLVMRIPNFEAPEFGLTEVIDQGTNGEATNIFDAYETYTGQQQQTFQERGDQLAQLIASTIEPMIWQRNGGEFSSIRFHRGMLIVRAPKYVQRQIGRPTIAVKPATKSE